MMFVRFVKLIVHAHHDVQRTLRDRRGDDHFFHPGLEVGVQLFRRAELAARLPYDAHAEVAPSPPI